MSDILLLLLQLKMGWMRKIISLIFLLHLNKAEENDMESCNLDGFVIYVEKNEPLGLLLSDKLDVREFILDAEGRSRVIEASGLVEVGDVIIAVNDENTNGLTLQTVVDMLQNASLPKRIKFRSHDQRCVDTTSVQNAIPNSNNSIHKRGITTSAEKDFVVNTTARMPFSHTNYKLT